MVKNTNQLEYQYNIKLEKVVHSSSTSSQDEDVKKAAAIVKKEKVVHSASSSSSQDEDVIKDAVVREAAVLMMKNKGAPTAADVNYLWEISSSKEGKISDKEITEGNLNIKKEGKDSKPTNLNVKKEDVLNNSPSREGGKEITGGNLIIKKEAGKASKPTNLNVKKEVDVLNISPAASQVVLLKLPNINSTNRGKKLLVLNLNGFLVDVYNMNQSIMKRPFCDDFLKFCFERFNVGVWSAKIKKNVDRVVDLIMGDFKQHLLFCWDQSHCTETRFKTIENRYKPLILKELKKVWDKHDEHRLPWEKGVYNESNTLLLDDTPYKAICNPPHTAIFPFTYTLEDEYDDSLGPRGDIRVYLEGIAAAENVQKYVEQHPFGQSPITNKHPSWNFYQRVIRSVDPKMDLSSMHFMENFGNLKIK